jgi:hypothetical protein
LFSFGREHEKECAEPHVHDPAQLYLVTTMIDSVHDLLEGKTSEEQTRSAVRAAFVEGGAGVWEQAGSWLRKLCEDYPDFQALWPEFASNSKAAIRFRAAAFLDDMPGAIAECVHARLANDRSSRVREMAVDRWQARSGRLDV